MKNHKNRKQYIGKKVFIIASSFLLLPIALSWSWNVIGVDLFGLPQAVYRHGLAFVIVISIFALILGSFKIILPNKQ